MNIQCSNCHSSRILTRNCAKKAIGLSGTVGGTVGGATSSLSAGSLGMTVGLVAGPPGMLAGGFLGMLIGAMLGGTTGGIAGVKLGEIVDERILDNYRCLNCGCVFADHQSGTQQR